MKNHCVLRAIATSGWVIKKIYTIMEDNQSRISLRKYYIMCVASYPNSVSTRLNMGYAQINSMAKCAIWVIPVILHCQLTGKEIVELLYQAEVNATNS